MPISQAQFSPASHTAKTASPLSNNSRLTANNGNDDAFLDTALKVTGVIFSIIATIAAFAIGGPTAGFTAALISTIVLLSIFNRSSYSHNHSHYPSPPIQHTRVVTWYTPYTSWFRTFAGHSVDYARSMRLPVASQSPYSQGPHVRKDGGHFQQTPVVAPPVFIPQPSVPQQSSNVGKGGGHFQSIPVPPQHGPQVPTAPFVPRPSVPQQSSNVGKGGGHFQSAPVPPQRTHSPQVPTAPFVPPSVPQGTNVGKGRGHFQSTPVTRN